jgi:hypothetical protein
MRRLIVVGLASLGILFGSTGTALATQSTRSGGICPSPPTSRVARPTASLSSRRSRTHWLGTRTMPGSEQTPRPSTSLLVHPEPRLRAN